MRAMTNSLLERFVERYGRLPTEVDPDYLEMLRMSKFRPLAVPDVQPGKCCNCGSSKNDGRGYIDVGLHIEWYGAVFFCKHCLKELATAMGLFEQLETQLAEALAKLNLGNDLQKKGEELHETVVKTFKELEEFYASLRTPGNEPTFSNSSNLGTGPPASEQNVSDAKQRTVKSSDGTGRKNVPSLTDLLNKS